MSQPTGGLAQPFELADTSDMRLVVLVLLTSSAISLAQQRTHKERTGRMVSPAGTPEPVLRTPPPVPRRATTPSEAVDEFFLALKTGQIDTAYDSLVKGSVIADRQDDVAGLKKRTQEAFDNYGPISGYETVDEQTVGTSLLRRTCISLNLDLPLRWRFYFYKSEGSWKLVDLRVDDGLVELFEDTGPARK